MAENSTPEHSNTPSENQQKTAAENQTAADSAAQRAPRLKRVAPVAGETRLTRLSKARRSTKGPVKHPRDLLGVSLADGRYEVKAPLGKGSMAYVFRAADARLQTDVVLKVPKPEKINTADFRERFQRESQMLIRFSHPHVVKVLDVGEYEELPYVVMQLLEGGSLSDRIARESDNQGRMTPESLKSWVREVARALDFCFRKGMVHRDVKPANILFDEDNNAYVGDFGLSKIMCGEHTELSSDETAAGVVLGTPNYISPEVVQGQDYDGRSDQYSLGITIYHVLVGGPPMQGNTATMTMMNQTQKVLPLLSDLRDDVPRPLAVAIRKAIEKDPAKRFNTCEEFAEAVMEGLRFAPSIQSSASSSMASQVSSASSRQLKSPVAAANRKPASPPAKSSASSRTMAAAQPVAKNPAAVNRQKNPTAATKKPAAQAPGNAPAAGRKTGKKKSRRNSASASSARRRVSSASSSLSIDADMDWFDMDASGAMSSSGSSSRSSSGSSRRRRSKKKGKPEKKLVNVFGQQLHPAVLAGFGAVAALCLVMVVWQPFAADEADPRLAPGQYFPNGTAGGQRSPDDNDAVRVAADDSKKPQPKKSPGNQKSMPDRNKDDVGKLQSPVVAKNDVAASQGDGDNEGGKPEAASEGPQPAEQHDQAIVAVVQPSSPEFTLDADLPVQFGQSAADVFVAGRTVRSRSTAKQLRVLAGSYVADEAVVLSPDGRWFAAMAPARTSRESLIRIWDTATGVVRKDLPLEGRRRVRHLYVADDLLYVETDRGQQLQVWNLKKDKAEGTLPLPDGRLRIQRLGMTANGSRLVAQVDGELSFLNGQTGVVQIPLAAPLPDPVQVASTDASPFVGRSETGWKRQSVVGIQFSPDQKSVAGLRLSPKPGLMSWDVDGQLQFDISVGLSSLQCQPSQVQWFGERAAWLANGSIVDAKYRRVVVSVPHDDDQSAVTALQDDDHLLTTLRGSGLDVYQRQIPWQAIERSLESMDSDESALLKPGGSVRIDIQVDSLGGNAFVARSLLTEALQQRLSKENFAVRDDSSLVFRIAERNVKHRQARATVLELQDSEEGRTLWFVVLGEALSQGDAGLTAVRSATMEVAERISTTNVPYYVPSEQGRVMLPICFE